jgi:hypothetical protein
VKSRLVVAAVAAASFVIVCGRPSHADEKPTMYMKQKLEMSQNILSSLTQGDFKSVEQNALQMNVVNALEKLVAKDQPHYKEYMRQLTVFETANRELQRMASEKNIEGATLAYTQMTVSCVQCHKLIRDAKK